MREDSTFGEAFYELRTFFEDGEVGAEVGVEDCIETEAAQGGVELAGGQCAGGESGPELGGDVITICVDVLVNTVKSGK